AKVSALLGDADYKWSDINTLIQNRAIQDYEHLATRIESEKIQAMIEEGRQINEKIQAAKKVSVPAGGSSDRSAERPAEIEFGDFEKVDLRIGQVVEAEEIKEADKLLRLKVDIGAGEIRQIIAGIKAAYSPDKLIGRKVLVCVNLKPRKMKFGMSEGMVLAAGNGGSDLFVLSADEGAQVGQRVK
ncbi:MAG: methionine--tRNA ligase subunit beta, partial [Bdellovibrio sp.]